MKYNYVPKCPRCGSARTGRFMYAATKFDEDKIVASSMLKGEIVRIVTGIKSFNDPNCFCQDCDSEWTGNIDRIKISLEDLEKIKKERKINDSDYEFIINRKKINKRLRKKKKTKEKLKSIKNEFRNIF